MKISLELPTSIRPSCQKSFSNMSQEKLDRMTQHKHNFKKLLFSLTVMHSVINQRERFGSFGWTQPYHFSPNDLEISLQTLEEVCNLTPQEQPLPMQLIQYLISDLNYGGKLINQEDKDILTETVRHFICQSVVDKSGMLVGGVAGRHLQAQHEAKLYDLAVQKIDTDEHQQNFTAWQFYEK